MVTSTSGRTPSPTTNAEGLLVHGFLQLCLVILLSLCVFCFEFRSMCSVVLKAPVTLQGYTFLSCGSFSMKVCRISCKWC